MKVIRSNVILKPDASRVLLRPFKLSSEQRVRKVVGRVAALSDGDVRHVLAQTLEDFKERHPDVEHSFRERFGEIAKFVKIEPLTEDRRLLIGAYLCHEYSVESAALFNPSMVWHPDQSKVPSGSKRFVLALRATGEGHISSIGFRTGIVDENCNVHLDMPGNMVTTCRL